MSTQITIPFNLVALYDTPFEDVMVHLTYTVPDDYQDHCPPHTEVKLESIHMDEETRKFLKGAFFTNVKKLMNRLEREFTDVYAYDFFVEYFSETEDSFEDAEVLDAWMKTYDSGFPRMEPRVISLQSIDTLLAKGFLSDPIP